MATYAIFQVNDPTTSTDPIEDLEFVRLMTDESVDATKKNLIERGVEEAGRYVVFRLDDLKVFEAAFQISAV